MSLRRFRGTHFLAATILASAMFATHAFAGGPFRSPFSLFATPGAPSQIRLVDLNGDCHLDVVAWMLDSNGFSTLLGRGDGTFGPSTNVPLSGPFCVPFGDNVTLPVATDLNGDGRPDLVFGNCSTNTVAVLLGNGDGTFGARADFDGGDYPLYVAVGDLNGDGHTDIACAGPIGPSIAVLLGVGDGTFLPRSDVDGGGCLGALNIADFDRDGHPDLAVVNCAGVSVLRGIGDGSFSSPVPQETGLYYATGLLVGDVDGDQLDDLVAFGNPFEDHLDVDVLRGVGDGSFEPFSFAGATGDIIANGDLNGDGRLDLISAGRGQVMSHLGTPFGYFGNGPFSYRSDVRAAAIGDLNEDGRADAVFGQASGIASVDGSFPPFVEIPPLYLGPDPVFRFFSVASGDVNGDGRADLVASMVNNYYNGSTDLYLGTSGPVATIDHAFYQRIVLADLNGDARDDAVLLGPSFNSDGDVALSAGGHFNAPISLAAGPAPRSAAVADFDGDAIVDLAITNASAGIVRILHGNGDGTFTLLADLSAQAPGEIRAADLNHDGHADLVLTEGGHVTIWSGVGDGHFAPPAILDPGGVASSLTLADLDEDGEQDLAVSLSTGIAVLLGRGDGTFDAPAVMAGPAAGSIVACDGNGDGHLDLAFLSLGVSVMAGHGDGTFGRRWDLGGGGGPISTGDFNQDGRADLVVIHDAIVLLPGKDDVDPIVHVDAPNPQGELFVGSQAKLSWSASDNGSVTGVDLLLSRHGTCGPFDALARNVPNTGTYSWTVTGPGTGAAILAVMAHDDAGNVSRDQTAERFAIEQVGGVEAPVLRFALHPIAPNPAFDLARVSFDVPRASRVRLGIDDLQGRAVARLVDGEVTAGRHTVAWQRDHASAGMYFVRLETPDGRFVRRFALIH